MFERRSMFCTRFGNALNLRTGRAAEPCHGDRDEPGDRFPPVPARLTICWAASMSCAWPMWLSQTAAQQSWMRWVSPMITTAL